MQTSGIAVSIVLAIAGIGIPIMAALNAGLGSKLGNPFAAVFALCLVASLCSLTLLIVSGPPSLGQVSRVPLYFFLGGFLFVFYLSAVTFGAPRIGLGSAIILVIVGQVACATLLDHFAPLGMPHQPIDTHRAAGLGFVILGVFLTRS